MISIEDIRNLATLARLKLAPAEEESLQKDISNILDYVGQVSAASASVEREVPVLRNVVRNDVPTPTLGERESLLNAFPKREGDFNVVRKILDKDAGAQ
jgi:aspartyl-tRNA(Asn)/glutamyl-tRNA(Gln) amidotransferase subunit C